MGLNTQRLAICMVNHEIQILECPIHALALSSSSVLHSLQQSEAGTIEGFTKSALLKLSIMLPTSRQELGAIFDIEGADIMRRILKVFYE